MGNDTEALDSGSAPLIEGEGQGQKRPWWLAFPYGRVVPGNRIWRAEEAADASHSPVPFSRTIVKAVDYGARGCAHQEEQAQR